MRQLAAFEVLGECVPQGSKNAFVVRTTTGVTRAVVVDKQSAKLKSWRSDALLSARMSYGMAKPFDGPVRLKMVFVFTRPKSHFTAKGDVHPKAPRHPSVKPDLDKLQRAVFDALGPKKGAGIIQDDSRVVEVVSAKRYGNQPKTAIEVWETD